MEEGGTAVELLFKVMVGLRWTEKSNTQRVGVCAADLLLSPCLASLTTPTLDMAFLPTNCVGNASLNQYKISSICILGMWPPPTKKSREEKKLYE